jgi:hypothetical protein
MIFTDVMAQGAGRDAAGGGEQGAACPGGSSGDGAGEAAATKAAGVPVPGHLPGASALVHFETCAKIEVESPKGRRLVVPRANVFQRRLFEAYETLLAVGVPEIRLLGLKIRQCGGTTAACHVLYHHAMRFESDMLVLADVRANAAAMLRKMRTFSAHDGFPWHNGLRPTKERMEWANGSAVEIASAEASHPGISRTRSAVLFSEACKYPRGGEKDDKGIMASVLPSVNRLGIAESTPEGASGWFYEQWHGTREMPGALSLDDFLAALRRGERSPGNGWVKVFAGWWEFEENARPVVPAERERLLRTLTLRERRGMGTYGWTPEQVAWRRETLARECGGSEDLFDEYYPEDEEGCFLASGRPRFDMGAVLAMERLTYSVTAEEGHVDVQETGAVFTPDGGGHAPIQMWERPLAGCRYLVWCDPATGAEQAEGRDPDAYSIGVLRDGYTTPEGIVRRPKVVARVRPPCLEESDHIAAYLVGLSRLYGDCMIVLEVNMGLHILEKIRHAGLPIYRREVVDPYDRKTRRYMHGWKLKDREQRRTLIDGLALAIRDEAVEIPCPHILKEARNFIVNRNGREEARSGCHDDDITGLAMGLYCLGSATLYRGPTRRRRKPADWGEWKRW